MTREAFDFLEEPRADILRGLLRWLATHSLKVSLVVRKYLGLNPDGEALLARLRPHIVAQMESSSWPGTTLFEDVATVLELGAVDDVVEEVLRAAIGLCEWKQPALPEDLAFIRSDGAAILTSIARERDAYLSITTTEYAALAQSVPDVVRLLRRRADAR